MERTVKGQTGGRTRSAATGEHRTGEDLSVATLDSHRNDQSSVAGGLLWFFTTAPLPRGERPRSALGESPKAVFQKVFKLAEGNAGFLLARRRRA